MVQLVPLLRLFAYFTPFKIFLYCNSGVVNYSINIIKVMSQASLRLSWYVLILASILFNSPSDGFFFTYFSCSLLTYSLYFSICSKSPFCSVSNNSWSSSVSFPYICSTGGAFELLLSLIVSTTFILFDFPEVSSACIFVSTSDFSVFLLVKLAVFINYSRVLIYVACCLKYSSVK